MRVKINETWYDSEDTAIVLQVTEEEQTGISQLKGPIRKVASFPNGFGSLDEMKDYMREDDDVRHFIRLS